MGKRKLTAAELAAYRELARAAAKLRRAQEAAERKRFKLQTAAELEREQRTARCAGKGVASEA
jgi:hypothetical protein